MRGQDVALDVTVVSPLQDALVQRAAEHPGHALEHRLEEKMRKSFDACHRQGVVFLPLTRLGNTLGRHARLSKVTNANVCTQGAPA
jgi:hypothetical protein